MSAQIQLTTPFSNRPGQFLNLNLRRALGHRAPWYLFLALLCATANSGQSQVNVLTRSNDIARTGANLNETILTPANVNSANFGKLYTVAIDAQVYAQPLFVSGVTIGGAVHDVVYVASMRNTVYAIDAPTGAILWQKNFGNSITPHDVEVDQNISWNTGLGILSTPVIDPSTNYMFFVTAHEQIVGTGAPAANNIYEFHLNAIDITTGNPVLSSPTNITATYKDADLIGAPLTFVPRKHNQRPSLALANGNIYIAFASHNDLQPYHGWVLGYSTTTLQQTAVFSDTTIGIQGGIWNAGGAPSVDAAGNVYISTGNGSFGPTAHNLIQTGNSFIKLSPSLQLLDYFTPHNSAGLNSGDQDLGSSGLLLLPDTNYIVGGGKEGVLYLVDTSDMGQFNSATDHVRQEFRGVYGKGTSHIHGSPTYFESAVNGPTTYVWGENDVLRAYLYNNMTGLLNTKPLALSTMTAPVTNNDGAMPGGFTSISANGKTNGIVWASTPFNDNAVHKPVPGVLYAFNADTLALLWSDKQQDARDEIGFFAKYVPPTIANGRLFIPAWGPLGVADGTGQLVAYGLLKQLNVSVANATITAGAAIPNLTGTVSGIQAPDTLGTTIVVTYSTTATATSPVGTYPITATVSGTSAVNYTVSVQAGTLTINAATTPPGGGGATNPISYPAGFAGSTLQLNGSAKLSGTRLRLIDGGLGETASAFYPTAQNLATFINDFNFQLTNPGADGFTMLIQNDGLTAMGAGGGSLGFGAGNRPGIVKGVAVKFDIYNNAGEGYNSTGLYTGGQQPTTPALNMTTVRLSSGDIFNAHAVYDGTTLTVTITDTVTGASYIRAYTIDIPGTLGSSTGYIGFSAGTGGKTATADILTWSYTTTTTTVAQKPLVYPTITLPAKTSGPAFRVFGWDGFVGGKGTVLDSTKVGDQVTLTVNVPSAGTYDIIVDNKQFYSRASCQFSVDGLNVGAPIDQYNVNANGAYKKFDFGKVALTAGNHAFTFTITGRNAASTGWNISFGQIILTPQ